MKHLSLRQVVTLSMGVLGTSAYAGDTNVTVTLEILSPANGTAQSPHWVGFHDGTFDLYDSGTPANSLPIKGSRALEQLAEDGDTSGIVADFQALQPAGVEATIVGDIGDLVPGEIVTMSFTLDSTLASNRYFSYGSMVLPSNDFFYANANPKAHPVFDENGNFIAQDFIVANTSVRDAGTEVNDEIPENVAFFGQTVNNTGVDENGVILDFGDPSGLVQFRSPADGGNILADPQFAMADFTIDNYPLVKISFSAEQSQGFDDTPLAGPLVFRSSLDANMTVPLSEFKTSATGDSVFVLSRDGNSIRFGAAFFELKDVTMAHLHLGAVGEAGPVVVNLLAEDFDAEDPSQRLEASQALKGTITEDDLVGPLAGLSLSALSRQIQQGNIYINIHTILNPTGEIRGQLSAP